MGGETVNLPHDKRAQLCKIIEQITWGKGKPPEAQTFELESVFQKRTKAVSTAVNTSKHITEIVPNRFYSSS